MASITFSTTAFATVFTTVSTTPPDALRAQFVAGRGVSMTTAVSTVEEEDSDYRQKSRVEFGPDGVVAVDRRDVADPRYPDPPLRYLIFKDRSYCQGWWCLTPPTKTWVKYEEPGSIPHFSAGDIAMDEPATLKALLARAVSKSAGGVYDRTPTTLYRGVISHPDLYRVSPAFQRNYGGKRPTGNDAKQKIVWRIWIGKDGLVRRVWTSDAEKMGPTRVVTRITDSLLRGWGAETHIQEPSASDSAEPDEWRDY
ncbi:hypothetical protein [Herbidospora daliensis]|uniref:hypothetical protein n=1 Tax=Herbidospora daliensis TaxID=295585 RepID=UPI0012F997F1|nr:hypothetical protein [Herbidospora daliensis]